MFFRSENGRFVCKSAFNHYHMQLGVHAVLSYKKHSSIPTSCVSYLFASFIPTLFLNFLALYSLCFLRFLKKCPFLMESLKILLKNNKIVEKIAKT